MQQFFKPRVLIAAASLLVLVSATAIRASGSPTEELPDTLVAADRMPELIYQAAPDYPADAKKQGIEGDVWIKALVNKDGRTAKVLLAESSAVPSLDKSALAAASKFRYDPAVQGDKPVTVWVKFKVKFTLDENCGK